MTNFKNKFYLIVTYAATEDLINAYLPKLRVIPNERVCPSAQAVPRCFVEGVRKCTHAHEIDQVSVPRLRAINLEQKLIGEGSLDLSVGRPFFLCEST